MEDAEVKAPDQKTEHKVEPHFADIKLRVDRVLKSYRGQFRLNRSSFGKQLHHDILAYGSGSGKSLDEIALELGLSIGQLERLYRGQETLGTSFIRPFRGTPPPSRIFKPIFVTTDGERKVFDPESPNLPEDVKAKNLAFRIRFNGAEVEFMGLETALFIIRELKK
jgi:hypothetical protein